MYEAKKRPHEAVFFFGTQGGIGFELERSKSFGLMLRITPSPLLKSLRRTPVCVPVLFEPGLVAGARNSSLPLSTKKDRMKRSFFGTQGGTRTPTSEERGV